MEKHISKELEPFVRRENCVIVSNTAGTCTIVDHGLTTQVASGSQEELEEYLRTNC